MKSEMTIRVVARQFDISARTLRYWEQAGLIESERMPEKRVPVLRAGDGLARCADLCSAEPACADSGNQRCFR